MAAIEVDQLVVRRGRSDVLHGVTARIRAGRVTGLIGPSGAGKTTLMRAIVGVQIVRSGAVRVLGEPAGSPALRSRVAYVTQAPSVYGDLTVRENLGYFARVLGVGDERVAEVLDTVALGAYAARVTATLSGGERARVSLASALLGAPAVLVLDEPTVGLDPLLRRELWNHFGRLAEGGATLLVSSHVMDEAARCDELLLMRDGGLLAATTPAQLRSRTGRDDLGEAFLAIIEEGEEP